MKYVMLLQPRENSTSHHRETRIFLGSGAIVIVLALLLRLFSTPLRIDPLGVTTAVLFLALNTFLWSHLGKSIVRRLSQVPPAIPETPPTPLEPATPSAVEASASEDEAEQEKEEKEEGPYDPPVRLGVFFLALFLKPLLLVLLFVLLAHASPLFVRSFLFGFIAHLIVTGGGLILSGFSGHLTPAPDESQVQSGEKKDNL